MSKIDEIQELIEKAREIQSNSAGFYHGFRRDLADEVNAIDSDGDLSDDGKMKKKKAMHKEAEKVLMERAKKRKDEYEQLLSKAKVKAENLIHEPFSKVDDKKTATFNRKLNELKTELMLDTNHNTAQQRLTSFIDSLDEPSFHATVRDEFSNLLAPVVSIAGSEAPQVKQKLFDMYEHVKTSTMSDEQLDASTLFDTSDKMIGAKLYNASVTEAANGDLGRSAAEYINKPHLYEESGDSE
jgi:ElaB/YqjD/DUF883 family membrane-anchored ribosome-binding protein